MPGLYIHIPFCKKACTYCDFHFSTAKHRDALLDAMGSEMIKRSRELGDSPVSTIYFGGGTPSLLEPDRISEFVQQARDLFRVDRDAEITLEANPDDITAERLAMEVRRHHADQLGDTEFSRRSASVHGTCAQRGPGLAEYRAHRQGRLQDRGPSTSSTGYLE
jgi:organic radical activating enzyme